jgi:dihydroorotate dehydrogenase (NAD+) catalytic subunit
VKPDMRVQFAGIELVNPVLAASGTFGYGIEFEEIVSLERIGGFVTKGLSREPMAGNEAPRLIETASGMMNSIGREGVYREEAARAAEVSEVRGDCECLRLPGDGLH